jgi:hypothetical protein
MPADERLQTSGLLRRVACYCSAVPADQRGVGTFGRVTQRQALLALALAYACYFGAVVYSDVRRPEDLGVKLRHAAGVVYASHVMPQSPAHRAGLQAGDLITKLGPVHWRNRRDALASFPRLSLDEPIPIVWVRAGQEMRSTLTVASGNVAFWSTRAGVTLALMRGMQAALLTLAVVIAWKQPHDLGAAVGAWLLATFAVYNIVSPPRLTEVWRELPAVVEIALWIPYLSSMAAGAILATFYAVFPQRGPRWRLVLGLIWVPTLLLLGLAAFDRLQMMYAPQEPPLPSALTWLHTPANLLLVALGAVVMTRNYRTLGSETERRRVRVVLVSSCAACLSAGIAATYWVWSSSGDLTTSLFSSWALTLGVVPTVLVPVSFAYAISRHRLFDISLILRRGLQYALARRGVLSLIPAVVLILLLDVFSHRDAPDVGGRVWWYAALLGVGAWIYRQRGAWLTALDRRYFREHYSAQRLLRELAEDVQTTAPFQDLLPIVVSRIEAALHPSHIDLLVRSPDGRFYESILDTRGQVPPLRFSAGDKAVRLLAVLAHPVVVGADAPRTVFHQLPDDERQAIEQLGTEVLVGIPGRGDTVEAMMVLGMKRSEEPFTSEDLDLLAAIALNLKPLLPLSSTTEECDTCGASYATGTGRCPSDGDVLVRSETPPVLADRYAVERRLGRGGMGTVYAARDLQLNRSVAVKLLRDRLASDRAVETCRKEARAAAALAHPNVVTIHDIGLTADGRPFLVMQLLRGRTLREALGAGPLPPSHVRTVFEGVCAALEAAHAEGLVHRDLKPENVFLVNGNTDAASVKLLDFGISTFVDDPGTSARSGGAGTPEYAAPEQLHGEPASPSWDVWALSVMAFEATVGVRPVACVSAVLAGRLGAEQGAWNGPALQRLTPALAALFGDALSLDGGQRPKTPAAFLDRLRRALD